MLSMWFKLTMLTDTDLLAGVDKVTDVTIPMWRYLKSNVYVCLAPEKKNQHLSICQCLFNMTSNKKTTSSPSFA